MWQAHGPLGLYGQVTQLDIDNWDATVACVRPISDHRFHLNPSLQAEADPG